MLSGIARLACLSSLSGVTYAVEFVQSAHSSSTDAFGNTAFASLPVQAGVIRGQGSFQDDVRIVNAPDTRNAKDPNGWFQGQCWQNPDFCRYPNARIQGEQPRAPTLPPQTAPTAMPTISSMPPPDPHHTYGYGGQGSGGSYVMPYETQYASSAWNTQLRQNSNKKFQSMNAMPPEPIPKGYASEGPPNPFASPPPIQPWNSNPGYVGPLGIPASTLIPQGVDQSHESWDHWISTDIPILNKLIEDNQVDEVVINGNVIPTQAYLHYSQNPVLPNNYAGVNYGHMPLPGSHGYYAAGYGSNNGGAGASSTYGYGSALGSHTVNVNQSPNTYNTYNAYNAQTTANVNFQSTSSQGTGSSALSGADSMRDRVESAMNGPNVFGATNTATVVNVMDAIMGRSTMVPANAMMGQLGQPNFRESDKSTRPSTPQLVFVRGSGR